MNSIHARFRLTRVRRGSHKEVRLFMVDVQAVPGSPRSFRSGFHGNVVHVDHCPERSCRRISCVTETLGRLRR